MFAGEVSCDLRTEELVDFRAQLARLYESLEGDAAFATMEGWLTLALHGDHSGHVRVDGELFDRAGRMGNALRFSVQVNQSYLPPIRAALVEVEPVGRSRVAHSCRSGCDSGADQAFWRGWPVCRGQA
jgi:hypothetical protein